MAKITVYNMKNEKVKEMELNDSIFNTDVKEHLIHDLVKAQLFWRRRFTASVKNRSEVKGTTKKPYRQKGTGRARQGSTQSPLLVGGGVIFGPVPGPRKYNVNKKVRKQALISALSMKFKDSRLYVVDKLQMENIRTKDALKFFEAFKVEKGVVVEGENENLEKSVKNLSSYKYLKPEGLNVYDILKYENVFVSAETIPALEKRLS